MAKSYVVSRLAQCTVAVWFVSGTLVSDQTLPFAVPRADLRVALDTQILRQAVQRAHLFSWGGIYDRHQQVCNSPDVHLELQNPDLILRSWTSWMDGNGGLHARLIGQPKAYTNDSGCANLGLSVACDVQGCMTELLPGFSTLGLKCRFLGIEFFNDVIVIQSPLALAREVAFELPRNPVPNSSGETSFEFGQFVNGNWVRHPFSPHRRSVGLQTIPRGFGGRDLFPTSCPDPLTCDNDVCGMPKNAPRTLLRRENTSIALDVSLPPPVFDSASTEAQAETALADETPIKAGFPAGLVISRRFLLGDAGRAGIFQRLLPIRGFGHQMVNGQRIEFEFFVTNALANYGKWENLDAIELTLEVSNATAWKASDPANRVAVRQIRLEAITLLPRFEPLPGSSDKAAIAFNFVQFKLGIHAVVGTLCLCVESLDLQQPLAKSITELARYGGPGLLLPECISVSSEDVRSNVPCKDGVSKGRLSQERPEKNSVLTLDFANSVSQLDARGNWIISVPMTARSN